MIFILDKDESLRGHIATTLQNHGFQTKEYETFSKAINDMEEVYPTILLVGDIDDVKRLSVTKYMSDNFSTTKIIYLIDNMNADTIIRNYKIGLDDFISKPIDMEHLITRVRIQLNDQNNSDATFKTDGLVLDSKSHNVKRGKRNIYLTPTEFTLLEFLMRNKNIVLSRDVLLRKVWDYDSNISTRVVDVNISSLREKITQKDESQLIQTVRGFGYKISEKE